MYQFCNSILMTLRSVYTANGSPSTTLFLFGLWSLQITVPLGGAKVTPAVIEVFIRARRFAEKEGSLTGMQHIFLALLHSPTFYKLLVNSGCDIDLFKE